MGYIPFQVPEEPTISDFYLGVGCTQNGNVPDWLSFGLQDGCKISNHADGPFQRVVTVIPFHGFFHVCPGWCHSTVSGYEAVAHWVFHLISYRSWKAYVGK